MRLNMTATATVWRSRSSRNDNTSQRIREKAKDYVLPHSRAQRRGHWVDHTFVFELDESRRIALRPLLGSQTVAFQEEDSQAQLTLPSIVNPV